MLGEMSDAPISEYWTAIEQRDDRVVVRLAPNMRRGHLSFFVILAIVCVAWIAALWREGHYWVAIGFTVLGLALGIPAVISLRRMYVSDRDNPLLVIFDHEQAARESVVARRAPASDCESLVIYGPNETDPTTRVYVRLRGQEFPVFLHHAVNSNRVRELADALAKRWRIAIHDAERV